MRIVKAPEKVELSKNDVSIFLAGSIELGKSENWRETFYKEFNDYSDAILLDPVIDNWNKLQNPAEQINWEQDMLEVSDVIAMYINPNTKSPISLMEFGQFIKSKKLIICCPEGFWKREYLEVMCERNDITLFDNFPDFINKVKEVSNKLSQ